MTIRCYREWDTELLLNLKKDLEFQQANWKRRINEIESNIVDADFFPSISEYKQRIKKCRHHLKQINKVLKERGVL